MNHSSAEVSDRVAPFFVSQDSENREGRWDIIGDRLEDWEEQYIPRGRVIWRDSQLGREVSRLYDAQSFLIWRYGTFFNTHVTLVSRRMGVVDHREFAALMAPWNKEMKRWLAVGNDKPRRRWAKRIRAVEPQEHFWLYVFEHGLKQGLHAHELCVVPTKQVKAFEEHTRAWWARNLRRDIPRDAIRVEHRHNFNPHKQYARQINWFRYLIKSADRMATMVDQAGNMRILEEVMKPEPYWPTQPIYTPQLYGICQSLNRTAQSTPVLVGDEAHYFMSKLVKGEFNDVYSNWEFEAYDRRRVGRLIEALQCPVSFQH